jgi:transcriptional regulator with XRE-family HTH domain
MLIMRRARFGETQAELAQELGITPPLLARIERGQDEVSEDTRCRLLDTLAAAERLRPPPWEALEAQRDRRGRIGDGIALRLSRPAREVSA